MQITEDLWNSVAAKFNDFKTDAWTIDHSNKDRALLYYKAVLREITGKEVFVTFPNTFSNTISLSKDKVSQENSKEFIKKMYRFFSDKEFLSRHDLVPAFKCIVPIMKTEVDNESIITDDDISTSEDSIVSIKSPEYISNLYTNGPSLLPNVKTYETRPIFLFGDDIVALLCHERYGYLPVAILFTSDSAEKVAMIYNECNNLVINYCNTVTKKSGYYINIGTISYSRLSFSPCKIELRNPINPEEIYNDGLPENEICNFIKSDVGGLSIFYGDPGCGKSTYIKYLATKFSEKKFNIISQDILFGYLSEVRNHFINVDKGGGSSIYIIEDCEKLLVSRETKENISTSVLSELLNMSDGILGDFLNIKFILTFNTKIPNIDEALLRKGRLKIKYEFTPLRGERLKSLAKKLDITTLTDEDITRGMSLADIFNYNNVVDFSREKEKGVVGFHLNPPSLESGS